MCVEVSEEKQHLEEEQAGGPDSGRPSKPGKDLFGDYRLDLEEKKRTQKDCRRGQ
jgi:hypothetical protein